MFDTLTVSDINRLAKNRLESLNNLAVKGEISNITYHSSGHLYFAINDGKSSLKALLFGYKGRAPLDLQQGDSVKIFGKLTIYEATGQFQMLCLSVEKESNKGELYQKFLLLKEQLELEGYFSEAKKQDIPYIMNLGVITSDKGAVIKDIVRTSHNIWPINIYLIPTQVQGTVAAKEAVEAINIFNNMEYIDAILLARGGGSFEDLNSFNDRSLAEAIFNSSKPIVSAIGHESDFVISDFVSDRRASTPTAAATLLTTNLTDLLKEKEKILERSMQFLDKYRELLKRQSIMLDSAVRIHFQEYKHSMKSSSETVARLVTENIEFKRVALNSLSDALPAAMLSQIEDIKLKLKSSSSLLSALDPASILKRGYASISSKGKALKSIKQVKSKDLVDVRLEDGSFKAEVV